jgi:hypothetical protein
MYNTTISNSYKDDKSGEWKTTASFSSADLLVVGELARQAFAEIFKLKQRAAHDKSETNAKNLRAAASTALGRFRRVRREDQNRRLLVESGAR